MSYSEKYLSLRKIILDMKNSYAVNLHPPGAPPTSLVVARECSIETPEGVGGYRVHGSTPGKTRGASLGSRLGSVEPDSLEK